MRTGWISSMVTVPKKNGQLRICLDPKGLNAAIQREHYPLPVIEDVATSLNGARTFSVLDASKTFWHVELDEHAIIPLDHSTTSLQIVAYTIRAFKLAAEKIKLRRSSVPFSDMSLQQMAFLLTQLKFSSSNNNEQEWTWLNILQSFYRNYLTSQNPYTLHNASIQEPSGVKSKRCRYKL